MVDDAKPSEHFKMKRSRQTCSSHKTNGKRERTCAFKSRQQEKAQVDNSPATVASRECVRWRQVLYKHEARSYLLVEAFSAERPPLERITHVYTSKLDLHTANSTGCQSSLPREPLVAVEGRQGDTRRNKPPSFSLILRK